MIPSQTLQVLIGGAVAVFYAAALATIGVLALALIVGRRSRIIICNKLGFPAFIWLGFVLGQGIVSVTWLMLALTGFFYLWPVWIVCAVSNFLLCIIAFLRPHYLLECRKLVRSSLLFLLSRQVWYFWIGVGLLVIILLGGAIALLPTGIDDALRWYLALPNVIAATHKLELFPFLAPYFGLQPLQVEMHWAALFTISNETAVTFWDYICALSSLIGLGLLGWALTSSRRVAVLAVLMMLSTAGFYRLIGGGKPDNAAVQYGIAAFLWVLLWPSLGLRAIVMAGLCGGWSVASRYTNIFLLPGLMVYPFATVSPIRKLATFAHVRERMKLWLGSLLIGSIAVGFAVAPMLIKNWLLLGCPLAPVLGCQETVWTGVTWVKSASWVYNRQGISLFDFLSYPFIWTFVYRPNMLGNISPLFVGFLPFLLLYCRSSIVRSGWIAGLAGLISVATWWLFVNGLFPYTRWILVPLGLGAVCLSSAAVAFEQDPHASMTARWIMKSAIVSVLLFSIFQSRGIVYAIRYVAAKDSREVSYKAKPGYDVATWLNTHIQPGQRVAFAGWNGYSYFVHPQHLLNSESVTEFQWLWNYCHCFGPLSWTTDFWKFYAERGFTYAVVARDLVPSAESVLPANIKTEIAFAGRDDAVLRINHQ